jgi:K+-sensing histidine kinase KdpD
MKKQLSWIDKMMIAVSFAEENAHETAVQTIEPQEESAVEASEPIRISPLTRLINLFKRFEDAMAATAYTDAGEFKAARDVIREGINARKKVLVGTDKQEIDLNFITYALKLSQRVEAGLEIFHLVRKSMKRGGKENAKVTATPKQLQDMLGDMGIVYHPVEATEPLEKELISHVSQRRDVMMVVLGSGSFPWKKGNRKKQLAETSGKLHCPLVIYEDNLQAV